MVMLRDLILFRDGVSVKAFKFVGDMHKYVNAERAKDKFVVFWALEDNKLAYRYRTQNEIDEQHSTENEVWTLKQRIKELENERYLI